MSADPFQFFVRFIHPERMLPPLPGVTAGLAAQLLQVSAEDYAAATAALAKKREAAVDDMLDQAAVASAIDSLPETATGTIVGFGDSLTDDFCSWFEMLKLAFAKRRPAWRVQFVNAGVSGDTTTQMLARMPAVIAAKPDWVICFAGANDLRRFGTAMNVAQSPVGHIVRNLELLRTSVVAETGAHWVSVTPAGLDQELADNSWFWQSLGARWSAADIAELGEAIAKSPGTVIDLRNALGRPIDRLFLEEDGLHPTISGQAVIAAAILKGVAPELAAWARAPREK